MSSAVHTRSVLQDVQTVLKSLQTSPEGDGRRAIVVNCMEDAKTPVCTRYNTAVAALISIACLLLPNMRIAKEDVICRPQEDGSCKLVLPAQVTAPQLSERLRGLTGALNKRLNAAAGVRQQTAGRHAEFSYLIYENNGLRDVDCQLISAMGLAHGFEGACSVDTAQTRPTLKVGKQLVELLKSAEIGAVGELPD